MVEKIKLWGKLKYIERKGNSLKYIERKGNRKK